MGWLIVKDGAGKPVAETMDCDPFFRAIGPAYTAALLDYLHDELEFGRDEEYRVSAFDVMWAWKHRRPGGLVSGRGRPAFASR